MKNFRRVLPVMAIAILANGIGEKAVALGAKDTYQQYLSSLSNCSSEAIQSETLKQCQNMVNKAINWANSATGNEYINSCNNKRTKFIYSVQQANTGISSISN